MGQKKIKELKRLAKGLPALNIKRKEGYTFYGHELIASGATEINGENINSDKQYQSTITNTYKLNHNKKIKAIYKKDGDTGVAAYMLEVKSIIEYADKTIQ